MSLQGAFALCHLSHFVPSISTSGTPSWLGPTIWTEGGDQQKLFPNLIGRSMNWLRGCGMRDCSLICSQAVLLT